MSSIPAFEDSSYGLTRTLPGVSYEEATSRVRAALAEEGFGVLTEIDVQATLKKKLDAQTRPYLILGACNPGFAHQALQVDPALGLLLPCNVVVSTTDEGGAVVSAIDPARMFEVTGREDLEPIATQVRAILDKVIGSL